jgi:hypothetical protein
MQLEEEDCCQRLRTKHALIDLSRFCATVVGPADGPVTISFVQALCAGMCNTHIMSARWIISNTIVAIGIMVAAALGFFLFQGEVLIAVFLGVPSITVIGGLLWLTHNLFAEVRP